MDAERYYKHMIVSGALTVEYDGGVRVTYRSLAEMLAIEAKMIDALLPAGTLPRRFDRIVPTDGIT